MEVTVEARGVCEECGNATLLLDPQTGEVACGRCGLVLKEAEREPPPEFLEKQEKLFKRKRCQLCSREVITSLLERNRESRRRFCGPTCRKRAHYLRKKRGWRIGVDKLEVKWRACPECGTKWLQTGLRTRLYDCEKCARKGQNRRYRAKHRQA